MPCVEQEAQNLKERRQHPRPWDELQIVYRIQPAQPVRHSGGICLRASPTVTNICSLLSDKLPDTLCKQVKGMRVNTVFMFAEVRSFRHVRPRPGPTPYFIFVNPSIVKPSG